MKNFKVFIAAVLALSLTACSFFIKDNKIEDNDGTYSCQVTLEGGSGRASVESPAEVVVAGENKTVKLVWSSSNYDYMLVDGTRFENEAAVGEHSVFTIPFDEFDTEFTVIGDTTAMSTPHEIEYTLTVASPGIPPEGGEQRLPLEKKLSPKVTDEVLIPSDYTKTGSLELKYATQFTVDYYKDSAGVPYTLVTIGTGDYMQQLLLSENDSFDRTYLVSTSVMDLISKIDALDNVHFSGTSKRDWYIKAAKEKISSGDILYAGKYSAPDYELLVSGDCNLAIENTMIYHNPEVKEKLEELNIPVIVERSSYEKNPLGRLEWIKLYGVLYNRLDEANGIFEKQEARVEAVSNLKKTGKKIAFFSVASNGQIVVRKPGDYISTMIDMAGGQYVPSEIDGVDENALSTFKMTTEDFYLQAADADILIYNSTIEGEINSVDELLRKAEIFSDFKAVKTNNVYCLGKEYFQKSGDVAEFIEDIHSILEGNDNSLTYINRLGE